MEQKIWLNAFFSPTGTTARIAEAVSEGSGLSCRKVDLSITIAEETIPDNVILAVSVPVFGGRVPPVALERLAALKGQNSPAVAIAVYGNRAYDNVLSELKLALERNGFRVIAAGAFIAEHSIVRSIAYGRPDADDLTIAKEFGRQAEAKVLQNDFSPVQVPGKTELPPYKGMDVIPTADQECTRCGVCAEVCPVGAIPVEFPNETNKDVCITCMRCVSICPQKARALPQSMLLSAKAMLNAKARIPKKPDFFF